MGSHKVRVGDVVTPSSEAWREATWANSRRFGIVTEIEEDALASPLRASSIKRVHVKWDGCKEAYPVSPGYLRWVGRSIVDALGEIGEEK